MAEAIKRIGKNFIDMTEEEKQEVRDEFEKSKFCKEGEVIFDGKFTLKKMLGFGAFG